MKYPYFRGLEADRYNFYRVPKALIKVDLFEKMSGDAKLLYAVLLDRMNLSLKNGWQDENGKDVDVMTAAFKEYTGVSLKKEQRQSIRKKLEQAKERVAKHREITKEKTKDRGQVR